MSHENVKTEHAGAKNDRDNKANTRAEVKQASRKQRRAEDRKQVGPGPG